MLKKTGDLRVQPPLHAVLSALTLVGVMLAGAWQMADATQHLGRLEFASTWLDFRQGRTTAEVERHLDQAMPARKILIAVANSVRYLLTRGGDAQVRVGKDEWLFLTDELRFEPAGNRHLAARAELFGAAARALDQQGVKLIVALVPDKARVYADRLSGARYPEYNRSRYHDALAALQLQGVQVVDLLKPLTLASSREEVYYRSDTHWNQAGAKVAAEAVALAVKGSGIELEETRFITESGHIPVERPGDLIRLMGLEGSPNALRPRPDREIPVTTRQEAAVTAGGLFDDAAVQVVLTGTSYSLRGNFHGYVQQALLARVLNTARDGGGLLQAPTSYLKNDAFHSAKPKVLLWEVPERFLYAKLDGELTWLKKVGLGD